MKESEWNSDSPRVFTRKKWLVQLNMAVSGIASAIVSDWLRLHHALAVIPRRTGIVAGRSVGVFCR
jgi:hypothetical protein